MDKSGAGAGFLRGELRLFPLPIYIPSASPQSSSLSPEAGTLGQEWPRYMNDYEIERDVRETMVPYFKVLYRHCFAETDENQEQSEVPNPVEFGIQII
jgi:hypothetical protein